MSRFTFKSTVSEHCAHLNYKADLFLKEKLTASCQFMCECHSVLPVCGCSVHNVTRYFLFVAVLFINRPVYEFRRT
jgi:hypothetical protein